MKTTAELKVDWKAARAEVEALRERASVLVEQIERDGKSPELHAELTKLDVQIRDAEARAALAGSTYMESL